MRLCLDHSVDRCKIGTGIPSGRGLSLRANVSILSHVDTICVEMQTRWYLKVASITNMLHKSRRQTS